MSTKSLNRDVLKNRFIVSFKMLCGRYQYIVEDYVVNCHDNYLQIKVYYCFTIVSYNGLLYYLKFRWCL